MSDQIALDSKGQIDQILMLSEMIPDRMPERV